MILSKPVQHIHRNWANAPCNSLNSPVDIALSSAHHSRAIQHKVTQQGLLWGCIGPPQHARLPRRTCFEHYPIQGYQEGPFWSCVRPSFTARLPRGAHRPVVAKCTAALCSARLPITAQCKAHFPVEKLHCPAQLHYPVQGGGCTFQHSCCTTQCWAHFPVGTVFVQHTGTLSSAGLTFK